MGLLDNLVNWLKARIGAGPKKTTGIPHKDYYNPGNGYFIANVVHVLCGDRELEGAATFAIMEINREFIRVGVPVTLFLQKGTPPLNSCLLRVNIDHARIVVSPNLGGYTPPEKMMGADGKMGPLSTVPWMLSQVEVWVRLGIHGDELKSLLLHEMGRHGVGVFAHSDDTRDVGHPTAKVMAFTAADDETLRLTYERRKRDGKEPA